MVAKKRTRVGGAKRRHRKTGRGLGSWLKGAAGKVNNFLKSSKIISKVAPVLGGILPGQAGNIANKIGAFAGTHGYGKRRSRKTGRGPYRLDLPPFSAGRGAGMKSHRRVRRGGARSRSRHGRGTPGMGMTIPTTYPISTSVAVPRF
jgi:hypothetical protein